jgi:hypothetical protein
MAGKGIFIVFQHQERPACEKPWNAQPRFDRFGDLWYSGAEKSLQRRRRTV